MVVLDTSVLTYAVGGPHPLREPSQRVVAAAAAGHITARTTMEVIQEFTHVRARRHGRADAVAKARAYAAGLSPLLAIDERTLERGLGLYAAHPRLGAFDSILAAAAVANGAEALVSGDRAFGDVRGLLFVPLDGPRLDALIDR